MIISSFFKRLFQQDRVETRGDVLFLRLIELMMIGQLLIFAWDWADYMSLLSDVVLPLGIANYLDITFLYSYPAAHLNALLITLLLLAGLFGKGKYSYLGALILMHLQYVARFSQGEISHGSNLTAMLLLSFSMGDIFFKDPTERRKVIFGLILFFAGFGYVSSAICKLVATGITWPDANHIYLWMSERSIDRLSQTGQFNYNALQEQMFNNYWLATSILAFGLLTELTGFLLWFRKSRWVQATLLISMHIGILVTMNIYFGPYIYTLLLIGYPWDRVINYLLDRFHSRPLLNRLVRE